MGVSPGPPGALSIITPEDQERIMRRIVTSIGVTLGSLLATAVPALAQTTTGYNPPPTVQPEVITQGGPGVGPAGVGAAGAAPAGAAPLAFTGAEIGLLVLAAALLATVGAMLLIAARRRSAATA
jgi:hypothetical protein